MKVVLIDGVEDYSKTLKAFSWYWIWFSSGNSPLADWVPHCHQDSPRTFKWHSAMCKQHIIQ